MPIMLLPFFPLVTVLVGMVSITCVRCHDFDCMDVMQDCDACWCYEEGGFGCFCCTVCHDHDNQLHDDSSEEFRQYYHSKKS